MTVGVVTEIEGGYPGPIITLRSDIYVLLIIEETGLEFASKNFGVMHACGHDFHTATILRADILIKNVNLNYMGRIIFQSAEENAKSANIIIKSGALDKIEAIFGMHNKPYLLVSAIGIKSGSLMASVDRFEIDVIGVGVHARILEKSIDSIIVASEIVFGLQTVISITRFHSGNTWNVIPEKAQLEGPVRTFQNDVCKIIPSLMKRNTEGIASAFEARIYFR